MAHLAQKKTMFDANTLSFPDADFKSVLIGIILKLPITSMVVTAPHVARRILEEAEVELSQCQECILSDASGKEMGEDVFAAFLATGIKHQIHQPFIQLLFFYACYESFAARQL